MLTLQIFAPAFGIKSPSPFSLKAIALLQMSGLEYNLEPADPTKTPNGKLPVLLDGDKTVPDSSHILTYLKEAHGFAADKDLDKQQLAIAEAFRRMTEDHLYWTLLYCRWNENGDLMRDEFFGAVPEEMRELAFKTVLDQINSALHGHGMGRHTAGEIHAFGAADLQSIASYLGDKEYFFGDTPTSIDATLYGILCNIIVPTMVTGIKKSAMAHDNLDAYQKRFAERFDMMP